MSICPVFFTTLEDGAAEQSSAAVLHPDGDVNQWDITNNAVSAWSGMPCWHFSLTDNPGIDHFSLPSDPNVLARLIADANAPRSDCN